MGKHSAEGSAAQADTAVNREARQVHAWRVTQLVRLGLASPVAEAVADWVDWHDVARLVERGCPAALAVTIMA
jgi:hypothetical protein